MDIYIFNNRIWFVILFAFFTISREAYSQGALTNGWMHTGTISPAGDSDSWTFQATNGQSIVLRVGEITSVNSFTPRIRLYSPTSVLLGNSYGSVAAEVSVRATNNGTFTVIVDDVNGTSATGTYRLTLATSGGGAIRSPGDEGGAMTNGFMHTGTIDVGDLDVWNFTATNGDYINVEMGATVSGSTLHPYVRLYGPDGQLLGYGSYSEAALVNFRATNSGTFTVVVGDGLSDFSGSGTFRLTLAKTGAAIVTAAGDEGGKMDGSSSYNGNISVGDLDLWTFTAHTGDIIYLQMNESVNGSSLYPWVRLYGRDGSLLNSVSGPSSAVINRTAPANGRYTVIVGDGSSDFSGSGTYQLITRGLSDTFRTTFQILNGTNLNIGSVGGISGSNLVLYTTTNLTTPLAQWTALLTNQLDQFGGFDTTNSFNRTERQRFYRLRLQ